MYKIMIKSLIYMLDFFEIKICLSHYIIVFVSASIFREIDLIINIFFYEFIP
jgi:hypothetical protein